MPTGLKMNFSTDTTENERVTIIKGSDAGTKSWQSSPSSKTILFYHHAILLTMTNTFYSLFIKSFPAFIAFVMTDFGYSYSFITRSLAISAFTSMSVVFISPSLLHIQSNILFLIISLISCIGCFILWYFRNNKILFIIGYAILQNMAAIVFACSNAMISSFVNKNDKQLSHKYLSLTSAAWTFATFLFFVVGYILKYLSLWIYLQVLFIVYAISGIINFLILPKIAVNKFNQIHHSSNSLSTNKISMNEDFKILFSIKEYRIIILILILTFIAWSYVYTSYGYWIKQIFNLNQAQLGIATTLIEGCANTIALISITYLSINDNNSVSSYKLKLDTMMSYFAMILVLSVIFLALINHIPFLIFLLKFKSIVYCLLFCYFCGSEGVVVGALILSVQQIPPSQQARSSAVVIIANSLTLFIGQFTVGIIYTEQDEMKLESIILSGLQAATFLACIYLSYIMKQSNLNKELSWINKYNKEIYYT